MAYGDRYAVPTDLGAEKFPDIKCRFGGLRPSAVVIVATARALKFHGGAKKADLEKENLAALEAGLPNLLRHVDNIVGVYGLPAVIAVNAFPKDTGAELDLIAAKCGELAPGVPVALSEVWARGGEGGEALAREVSALCERLCEQPGGFRYAYDAGASVAEKIGAIARKIYRAASVSILPAAQKQIGQLERLGLDRVPVCMAKTQYSFSDDPALLGAPSGWTLTVRNVRLSAGAGFIVASTGDIMTMPGLSAVPAAEKIDVDPSGAVSGLF